MNYKFASFLMSETCNFDCSYCHTHRQGREKKLVNIKQLIQALKKAYPKWIIGMTGGEPFLYPNFLEVCQEFVRAEFKIAIDTNLTIVPTVKSFIKTIKPECVEYIYASVHVLERERIYGSLSQYIESVKMLDDANFPIHVNYVMSPPLFSRFRKDYDSFISQGIKIELKPFSGIYKGKLYPGAYTTNEKRLILSYSPDAFKKTTFFSRGLRCGAGMDLIRIWPDGRISRCVADDKLLGSAEKGVKLFDSAQPCLVDWCPCFGWKYVHDRVTKERIKKDMGDKKLKLHKVLFTPRVFKKVLIKIHDKGIKALLEYV
jgi:MoaA/NifB/PqqE/SkfB family radical SAM enzyme